MDGANNAPSALRRKRAARLCREKIDADLTYRRTNQGVAPVSCGDRLMDGSHSRTLQRALEALGNNKERLSIALEVPLPELEAYLAGEKPLPHAKFIEALDIVANSPR
jgi:hypothetical protein